MDLTEYSPPDGATFIPKQFVAITNPTSEWTVEFMVFVSKTLLGHLLTLQSVMVF